MNPALAALIVLVAALSSTALVLYVHRRETKHWSGPAFWIGVLVWFLAWYAALAFLVRPH